MIRGVMAAAALELALSSLLGRVASAADAIASFLPLALPVALLAALPWPGRPTRFILAICGVALLLGLGTLLPEWARRPEPQSSEARTDLVIVTHNVALANRDPEGTIAELLSSRADILLLQETDGTLAPYLSRLATTYPYRNRCIARCSLAIFSRLPLDVPRYKFRTAGNAAVGPPLQQTRVHLPNHQQFALATLHLPWPLPAGPQKAALAGLALAMPKTHMERLILAGDFNLTPWSQAMRSLERQLKPLRRATHAQPSYPARIGRFDVPPILPIDHMFVGPEWEVLRVERLARTGSDHYPLRIGLKLSTPESLRQERE